MLLSAVRTGIADAIRSGVTSTPPLTVYAFLPDSVVVPCAFVRPDQIAFDKTMNRGTDEITCEVILYVSRADDESAQELLDGYLAGSGPASFKTALVAARGAPGQPALGGACDDVHLVSARGYRWYRHNDITYLGAELTVRCIGEGDSS